MAGRRGASAWWCGLFATSGLGIQLQRGAHAGRLVQQFVIRRSGATYGVLRADTALIDPANNAAVVRVKRGVLLFSNTASRTARERLTLRLSCNDGATWPASRVLVEGAAAYSTMAMLPNGDVGVSFERGALLIGR